MWFGVFVTAMCAGAGVYLIIDVFDRVGEVLQFSPSSTALVSYFLFKLPKILFDVFPAACLLATLVSIGRLMRTHEIVAMRACGMSTRRIALPLAVTALVLSIGALLWSEAVVPVSATRSRWLWDVELKQKVYRGVFDAASLWFESDRGFVHIRRYDAGARTISGLALYEADPEFRLQRVTEIDSMTYSDGRWVASAGVVKDIHGDDLQVHALAAGQFVLDEDPENLTARKRQPEEFSFLELRRLIAQMKARGLAADDLLVDLHRKLAWPFAGFVVTVLAVPVALRAGRSAGLARGTVAGLVIGFSYWILTGLALSAGRTGQISPPLAAWATNLICAVLAASLYVSRLAR
jgi:lipopolysaccharide export system permease protein